VTSSPSVQLEPRRRSLGFDGSLLDILAEGRLWQSLLLKARMSDTSGVLALAGHNRRAPISGEVVVSRKFFDSASNGHMYRKCQYCQNNGPRLVYEKMLCRTTGCSQGTVVLWRCDVH